MGELVRQVVGGLVRQRWGLTALLGAGAALIGSGVVAHDSAEGQAAGLGVVGLVVVGVLALVASAAKRWAPPAPPAGGGGAA